MKANETTKKKEYNYKPIPVNFNMDNEKEKKMYEYISSKRAKGAYLKDLIERDMAQADEVAQMRLRQEQFMKEQQFQQRLQQQLNYGSYNESAITPQQVMQSIAEPIMEPVMEPAVAPEEVSIEEEFVF